MIVKGTKQLGSFRRGIDLYIPQRRRIDNFWDFTTDSAGKTLTGFNVEFVNGQIIADWEDGSSTTITSSVNYNKTFS